MTALRVILTIAAALALQTTLARFLVRGEIGVDLVLVAVVFLALRSGPTVGIVSGTMAGLAQDALTSGIVGIGGLAKTLVGFLVGTVGTTFILTQSVPRFLVFFGATVLQMAVIIGFHALLDPGPISWPLGGVVAQALGNALIGLMVFQVTEGVPRLLEHRRAMGRGRARR
ncbi:MAG TPA: rod shape-determining protein MreD [Vicinamibacterales bacterium]